MVECEEFCWQWVLILSIIFTFLYDFMERLYKIHSSDSSLPLFLNYFPYILQDLYWLEHESCRQHMPLMLHQRRNWVYLWGTILLCERYSLFLQNKPLTLLLLFSFFWICYLAAARKEKYVFLQGTYCFVILNWLVGKGFNLEICFP